MTTAPVNAHEQKRRDALRPVLLRLPDTRHPGFAQECQRQSLRAAQADAADPSRQPLMNAALAELAALTGTGQ
ncbi:MAG: DUF3018 family protein [Comamonadaceae bacterium]|nr:DUF3018 family protein [Comamonadaceae bacterium]